MEYLKLQRSFRRTSVWQGATAAERGAWVSLAGYCSDEENGGRIIGASTWKPRAWTSAVGVDLAEVEAAVAAGLASWDGYDLVVGGYDIRGEQAYQARRKLAKDAGEASGRARKEHERSTWNESHGQPSAQPHGSTEPEPHGSTARLTTRSTEPEPQPEPISISTPMANGSGGAEGSPRDPAAPPDVESWEDRAHQVLSSFALATDPKSLREWLGHLRHVACTAGPNETQAYLTWATDVAKRRKLRLRYAREFEILGQEWNNGERERQKRPRRTAPADQAGEA